MSPEGVTVPASATVDTEDSNATPKASVDLFMMKGSFLIG
jgi:hypothetical protein